MGLSPDSFWDKTPREIELIINARGKLIDREQKRDAWVAWHVAALQRQKKLPKLETMMGKKRTKQSWQQIQATMGLWIAATAHREQQ